MKKGEPRLRANPNPHGRKKGASALLHKPLKKARAELIMELRMRGMPIRDIANQFGISPQRVSQEMQYAEEQGLIENVRSRLAAMLAPAASIYEQILTTAPHDLKEVVQVRKLQLEAARDLTKGLGAMANNTVKVKQTLTMDEFLDLREARRASGRASVAERESLSGGDQHSLEAADAAGRVGNSDERLLTQAVVDSANGGSRDSGGAPGDQAPLGNAPDGAVAHMGDGMGSEGESIAAPAAQAPAQAPVPMLDPAGLDYL